MEIYLGTDPGMCHGRDVELYGSPREDGGDPVLDTENIQASKKIHRDLRGFWKFLWRRIKDPKWRCGPR